MSDPERIYLQPLCRIDPSEGRLWCASDEWRNVPDHVCPDHRAATQYVRADLLAAAEARIAALEAENARLRARRAAAALEESRDA
jgi:hypothetical protein